MPLILESNSRGTSFGVPLFVQSTEKADLALGPIDFKRKLANHLHMETQKCRRKDMCVRYRGQKVYVDENMTVFEE